MDSQEFSETKDLSEAVLSCWDIVACLQSSPIAISLGRKSEGSITVCSGGALSDRGGVTHRLINIYFNEKLGESFSEKELFTNHQHK